MTRSCEKGLSLPGIEPATHTEATESNAAIRHIVLTATGCVVVSVIPSLETGVQCTLLRHCKKKYDTGRGQRALKTHRMR